MHALNLDSQLQMKYFAFSFVLSSLLPGCTIGDRGSDTGQCTMGQAMEMGSFKNFKSKGLVFAQFWSKSENSSSDWWTTGQILKEKYSRHIFAKKGVSIDKKPERGVRPPWNLACKKILWFSEKNLKITFWSQAPFIVKMGSTSENWNFHHFSQFLLKGFKQNSMN